VRTRCDIRPGRIDPANARQRGLGGVRDPAPLSAPLEGARRRSARRN
jgi:hypothetical protein